MVGLHGAGQMLLGIALVMPALLDRRGGTPQTYAAVMAATGIGAVAASAVVGTCGRRR